MDKDIIKRKLRGNIVPVPGQFHDDLSINISAYQEHVRFLIDKGIRCFYLAISASEFDYMTENERVAVTRAVADTLSDDCLLIAQALGGHWIDEQIDEAKKMIDSGADAIVVAPLGIKEGNKFFSSFYARASYSPERHDDYYVEYMERFARETNAPLIYHDKPFKSGKGPSMDMLARIISIENVVGLKEHVPDPLTLQKVYSTFGKKVACYDGFGKTLQFWSLQWGASGRHTCWSWFDPERDIEFVNVIESGDLNRAAAIIISEWPVAEAISQTGFQGYKYIMKRMGLPAGPCRIPGEELTRHHEELLDDAISKLGLLT